jgi:hypothetical protein
MAVAECALTTPAAPGSLAPVILRRTLSGRAVTLFGLAYLAPIIVLGTYGVLAVASHGTTASAYLLSLVVMIFTAVSYDAHLPRCRIGLYLHAPIDWIPSWVPCGMGDAPGLFLYPDGHLAYRRGFFLLGISSSSDLALDHGLHPDHLYP